MKNRKKRVFTEEERINITETALRRSDSTTVADIAKDFGVPTPTLSGWIHRYGNEIRRRIGSEAKPPVPMITKKSFVSRASKSDVIASIRTIVKLLSDGKITQTDALDSIAEEIGKL